MKYSELQPTLQSLTNRNIALSEIARALNQSNQNMHKRANQSKADVPKEEIELLEEVFGVSILEDTITIDHIHIKPSCGKGSVVEDEPAITPVKMGTNLIQRILKVSHPDNLKTVEASGDSMDGGSTPISDGDILLVDMGRTDYANGGVFLLTINNEWFIKRLRLRITGELDIISDNEKYPVETLTPETFREVCIKGRVIKNLSRGL